MSVGERVIIWLHGAFGAGKSSVAEELGARLPSSLIFDPELVGEMLSRILPVPTGDFQDLAQWRELVVATAVSLHARAQGPLIAPMTLLREPYAREVIGGIRQEGIDVRQVLLDVQADELRRRIDSGLPAPGERDPPPERRRWRLDHLPDYNAARAWLIRSVDLTIDTTRVTVPDVAAHVHTALRLGAPRLDGEREQAEPKETETLRGGRAPRAPREEVPEP